MAEHTGGSWYYHPDFPVVRQGSKDGPVIATIETGNMLEGMANTRLISRSPKMFNALEKIAGLPHGPQCPGVGAKQLAFNCNCHVLIAKRAMVEAKGKP